MYWKPDDCWSAERPVEAVIFDLDDTIYPQAEWLAGAWCAVAEAAVTYGVDPGRLRRSLHAVAEEGSDRGRVIDRALESLGAGRAPVRPLVAVFRRYRAARLWPFPGAAESLRFLSSRVTIGLVTDGDPDIQRSKLRALRLDHAFDVVVLSDELGVSRRKPHPAPLIQAAATLGVDRAACVYIGDRPAKDVAAAQAARMRSVRVRTGEYMSWPDTPRPWLTARDVPHAVSQIAALLAPRSRATPVPIAAGYRPRSVRPLARAELGFTGRFPSRAAAQL